MCFSGYVCVCVWALLCLQDAQRWTGSLKRFGYKVKRAGQEMETKRREREREGRERKATGHNNKHKRRAGSAKCGQQSLYLCDADSPKGELEKVFTLTRTFRRTPFGVPSPPLHTFFEQYLRVENNSSLNSPPTPRLVSIQGSCEQGLKPLLATLNSPLCSLCNYFSFKSIIRTKSEVKWQAPHGHNFLQQACANSTDLLPAHLQTSRNAGEFIHTFIVLFIENNK